MNYLFLFLSFIISTSYTYAQTAGEYKTEYKEYIGPSADILRYCYVWDTKSGNAVRYYFTTERTWVKGKSLLPTNPLNVKGTDIGEVMLCTSEYPDSKGIINKVVYYYSTKTGKVVRYYLSEAGKWEKSTAELDNPIESSQTKVGELTMNAIEYYNAQDVQFRTMFFCNTITGKTVRYYFSHEQKKWLKSDVALPDNPTKQ